MYDYFGCSHVGDGQGCSPPTGGNIQTLLGQPATWAEGISEAYMYQQPPDHYPDLITASGGTIVFECQAGEGRLVFHSAGSPGYRTVHATFVFGAIKEEQSTTTKQGLMVFYVAHLLGDSVAPRAPQQLSIDLRGTVQGPRLQFAWSPVTQDVNGGSEIIQYYALHRGTEACFAPTADNSIGQTPLVQFVDRDPFTVGDPATNHFYVVRAVDMGDNVSEGSDPVGGFDYLTGGR